MFREMRRKGQQLTTEQVEEILTNGNTGVLAVHGDDGYPYTVPLNYAYENGKIFFHCALNGHKLDGIRRNDKVSFCVVARDDVVPKAFATRFASVIAFGRAKILTDPAQQHRALMALVKKYSMDFSDKGRRLIESGKEPVCAVEITLEHATGKRENPKVIEQGLKD